MTYGFSVIKQVVSQWVIKMKVVVKVERGFDL